MLEAVRHQRKLRRGALTGNRFRLRVRDVSGLVIRVLPGDPLTQPVTVADNYLWWINDGAQ